MKKLVGFLVLILVAYFVAKDVFNVKIENPFAGKSEVPESVVEEMQSEMMAEIALPYTDCTWEITHNPDRERHLDTVDITAILSGEYGSTTFYKSQTYQYYKENDIWRVYESGYLEILDQQWDVEGAFEEKTFEGNDSVCSYTITFSDLDMQSETITATYRFVYYDTEDLAYDNIDYYITALDGRKEVSELSGTIRCSISESISGYAIKEVIGYKYADTKYFTGYAWGEVILRASFIWPTQFEGAWISIESN